MEMGEVHRAVARFHFPALGVNWCQGFLKILVQFNGKVPVTQLISPRK